MRATLTAIAPLTERDTLYTLHCPTVAQTAVPGQFVEILVGDGCDPFLRRPISIFDADGDGCFSLLVRTVGRGTQAMARWRPGAEVDVLGPLGNGFTLPPKGQAGLLVAGGIGLAPLHFLARRMLARGSRVHLLFAPARDRALVEATACHRTLQPVYAENRVAVPPALELLLQRGNGAVYACGPEGLLEQAALAAARHGISCQLSVERRMACGIGICLGCAIAIRTADGMTYKKVCCDGPVFGGEEVIFHAEA